MAWAAPPLNTASPIRNAPLAVTIASRPALDVEIRMMNRASLLVSIAWVIADGVGDRPGPRSRAPQHHGPGLLSRGRAGRARRRSRFAVDDLVSAPHEAVVEVGATVDLHVAVAVVDDDVVAGPADEVRRRRRVADLQRVVAGVAAHGDAVHVVGAQVVVAGVTPHHRIAARADGDAVVAGPAADRVVAAPPVDGVVTVAADDDVVPSGAVDQGRAGLARGVEPGAAGRATVAQAADGPGGAGGQPAGAHQERGGGGHTRPSLEPQQRNLHLSCASPDI